MRLLTYVSLSLTVLSLSVSAERELAKAGFPSCSLECWQTQLTELGCSSTDTDCSCSAAMKTTVVTCAATSSSPCNGTETLRTMGIVDEFCGVKNEVYQQKKIQYTVWVGLPVTLVFVALRFYSRASLDVSLGIDDWLILVAACLLCGVSGTVLKMAGMGFGQHTWFLPAPAKTMTDIFKIFYIGESIYIGAITFTKLSLLFFFRRLFPSNTMNKVTVLLMVFVIFSNIVVVSILIFQCIPIKGVWINWMYVVRPVKCLNQFAAIITAAIVSILHDVVILATPLPILWSLNLNLTKKLNLLAMFSVGVFVIICSLIRVPTLLSLESTSDPSWDEAGIAVWTILEIAVGIICACLPATRSLFSNMFPTFKMSLISKGGGDSNVGSTYALQSKQKRSQIRRIDSQASFFELSDGDGRKSNVETSVQESMYTSGSSDDKDERTFQDSLRPKKEGNVMSRIATGAGGIIVTTSVQEETVYSTAEPETKDRNSYKETMRQSKEGKNMISQIEVGKHTGGCSGKGSGIIVTRSVEQVSRSGE